MSELYQQALKKVLNDEIDRKEFTINGKVYDNTRVIEDAVDCLNQFIAKGDWTDNDADRDKCLKTITAARKLSKIINISHLENIIGDPEWSDRDAYLAQRDACKFIRYLTHYFVINPSSEEIFTDQEFEPEDCIKEIRLLAMIFLADSKEEFDSIVDEEKLKYALTVINTGSKVENFEKNFVVIDIYDKCIAELKRWLKDKE